MKRRRSSAPGRLRPDGRKLPLILLLAMATVLGACGQATSTDSSTPSPNAGETDTANPTDGSETPSAAAGEATPAPEPTPASPPPGGSSNAPGGQTPNPESAAGCSGSDENRDFFASMAAAVDWTVYCPVLPDGWFVDDGQYRLAGGGWMRIGYDGPGEARILLQQGAFCAEATGCAPSGHDIGETAFGDRTGVLVAGDDGSWSIVVDRGAAKSWLLTVSGMDEAGARTIAADLHLVDG